MLLKKLLIGGALMATSSFAGGVHDMGQFSMSGGPNYTNSPFYQLYNTSAPIPEGVVFRGCETTGPCQSVAVNKEYQTTDKAFQFVVSSNPSVILNSANIYIDYDNNFVLFDGSIVFPAQLSSTIIAEVKIYGQDTQSLTDISNSSIEFVSPYSGPSIWVDLHYSVNGKAYENVRMTNNGTNWVYVASNLKPGDTLEYYYTIGTTTGAFNTETERYVKPTLNINTQNQTGITEGAINYKIEQGAEWVDVHYSINNQGQQNMRMQATDASTWTIPAAIATGDQVTYSFTVFSNGSAFDTEPVTEILQ